MAARIIRYADIGGKKFKLFSKEDRLAHYNNISHDHITQEGKKETVKHFGKVEVKESKRAKGYERQI